MLSGLRPESLKRLRFPLAELTKPEVRELARRAGLEVAGTRREPGPLLPRRPGQARVPPAARGARGSPRGGGRPLGSPPGAARRPSQLHGRAEAGPAESGGGEPLYVLETDAAANRVVAGSRDAARDAPDSDPGHAAQPPRGAGRRGAPALPLASPGVPGAGERRGRGDRLADRAGGRSRSRAGRVPARRRPGRGPRDDRLGASLSPLLRVGWPAHPTTGTKRGEE